jgi:hypothetical protein
VGGASSGKTFTIVRRIMARGLRAPGSRHAILRFRWNAARATVEPTDPDLERAGRSHHLDIAVLPVVDQLGVRKAQLSP